MKKLALTICSVLSVSAAQAQDKKDFTMDGELGLIATSGNTQSSSLKAKLNAKQDLQDWQNSYIVEGFYKREKNSGNDESQTSAQKFFSSVQADYKLENPAHRLFVFGSFEDDRFSGFKHQATIAGGWSEQLWKDESSAFKYSVGPGYSFAKKDDGENASGVIVRAAADYDWKISDNATFRQLVSTEVGSDNTKSKSETSLSAKINGSLAMKLSFIMNHNSNVEAGKKKLDTETAVTLVYTFF